MSQCFAVLPNLNSHYRCLVVSKKDLVNSTCSELELGAFMGIEMKRGLTANGLRQAEVEYYLWAGCSMFPFVQIITDMHIGGAAFYRIGSSSTGFAFKSRRMNAFLFYYCARNSMSSKQPRCGVRHSILLLSSYVLYQTQHLSLDLVIPTFKCIEQSIHIAKQLLLQW